VTADPVEWLEQNVPGGECDPFAEIQKRLACFVRTTIPGLPPFQGGVAGLFGYGLQHAVERLPRPRRDEFVLPDLAVGVYDWVLAFDHADDRAWLISTGYPDGEPGQSTARLRQIRDLLQRPPVALPQPTSSDVPDIHLSPQFPLSDHPQVTSNFDQAGYLAAVQRVIDYIRAGDCFQVNLSQRLLHPAALPPLELYRRLRERNPAPFAGYLELGPFAVASASPERFVRIVDSEVETRPIKGTRPRSSVPTEDRRLREELRASAKDRAENVMIVDLLRNDLGRVCTFGSIRVPRVCEVESFRYVHHLVSEVRGKLRPDQSPVDLLRASFPGGSVTGAPKVRAMEIIAELEPTARGPYCGCLGYIGFVGTTDTNILIRP
jgi:para-aminobenzoate synthetase component 1